MSYKPFKMKGSPMKKNFGIGTGTSPWKEGEDNTATTVDPSATEDDKTTGKDKDDTNEQGGNAEKADKPWVKALKIGTTLLSGGIQGVYGGKREIPKINYGRKKEESTLTPEQKIDKQLKAGSSGTYAEYLSSAGGSAYSKEEWTKLNQQKTEGSTDKNGKVNITNTNSIIDGKKTSKTT